MADIRRRKNADGSIGYQVRYMDPSTKSGFGYKTFAKAKGANHYKAEKDLEEASGTHSVQRSISVPDAIENWLNICEKVGRDGREPVEHMTLVEYRRRAAVMCAYSWSKSLNALKPTDIVQFRSWLLENRSRDLARRTLSSFRSVLIEMKLQGYIETDPSADITVKSGGRYEDAHNEIEIPSDREMRDILAATHSLAAKRPVLEAAWARYRPMIYLAAFTGLRMSETRGLSWPLLKPDCVEVRQRADKNGTIGPVKSRAGRRTIEVSTQVTDLIFEWRDNCPASPDDLVFPTSKGKPILLTNFTQDAWAPLMKEAGLIVVRTVRGSTKPRPKYTPHALRHYYASKLIEKGKDLKYIQTRMGHSRIETTLNIYGHLMKDRQEAHQQTAYELASDLLTV